VNHNPNYILLPASPVFITASLLAGFLLNLVPWGTWVAVPDFVALVLVFWSIHQPRRVSIGIAFLMGLLMDVHDASVLGENALAYTLLSYFAIMIHRRVLWFPTTTQALHVLPLFFVMQVVQMMIQLIIAGKFPGWLYFLESFATAALWPIAAWILMAPQRRAVDHDDIRPL
jgi:rod shape-determining protein MreD